MYKVLIQRLRNAAQWADLGLVITPNICLQAAEAIEDLQKQIAISEANNIKLTRLLEEAYNPPT